jgi:hypothetical protein
MRVDDGAATATNNGNIEDRTTLKTNLSGVIVDDFGMPVQGFTVSAYGRTTTSGADGHWVMNDVPVTGVTVNSTAQNLEQTNLSTSGRIYVTYQKEGYATYHSRIDNAQAVITHYGTAGGNPNSIVVSNLVASDRVKIPALINSVTGILIDKGTLWDGTVGTYETAPAGVQVRLVPEVQASETAAGWALYGGSSCQTECGFFGLPEYVTQTDASGAFTFGNVAKLDGGYVLRIDNYGYRASERPNDVAGFSYNWDANNATSIYGGNFTPLNVTQGEWEITDDTLGIGFDVHGSNSIDKLINLGPLYIQDYLVANFNTVEGISVLDQTYNPNDDQGFTQDDGHNALDGATALDGGGVLVDSSIVSNLGTTAPLRFIFSGDMRALADLSGYPNGVIVFDGAGNRVSIDTSKTKLIGRVLELYSTSALTDGTYYVRLHRDVFVDMDAKRLETSDSANAGTPDFDPTDTTNTVPVAGGTDDTINLTDDKLYAEYKIVYTTVDVETTALSLAQSNITDATRQQIAATGGHLGMIGTELHVIDSTWKNSDGQIGDDNNEDDRLDILYNAIRDRYDEIYNDDNDVVVRTDVATVSFEVTKGKHYRVRVFDPNPSGDAFDASLVSVTNVTAAPAGTNGENNLADEDIDPTAGVNTGEVLVDNDGNPFAIWSFTALNTGTATVDLMDVGIGYKVAVVKANDFADFAAYDDAMTIELQDDLAPLVALQHSDRSGQDKTNYNNDVAPHDSIGMLVEFGELTTDEAGEPINGETKIYYPKLNLTASLYDECHKRAKSENVDMNYDDALEPQNQTQLDNYYNLTPLLATKKTLGAFNSGTCATLSATGTTCATGRNDNIYTADDYSCWYGGTDSVADSCKYYAVDPGDQFDFYEVPEAGGTTIDSTATAAATSDISTTLINNGQFELFTFATPNTFVSGVNSQLTASSAVGYKGHPTLGPTGCLAVDGTPADVARNLVIDMTESVASINNSDDSAALQTAYETGDQAGNIATGATLADDGLGLLHLETPVQHNARSKVYWADTAGSTISSRSAHLIATIGDWRTITETGRYLTSAQDIDSNNDLLYRAEDFVIDSESDGADEKSILKLHGEKDADNTDLSIAAGHASGLVFVDATPPLAKSFTVTDSTLTVEFDQPILDDANYPANRFLDVYGDDFVYRLDIDAETMRRGIARASVTEELDVTVAAGANSIDVRDTAGAAIAGYAANEDLFAGTKIRIDQEVTSQVVGNLAAGTIEIPLDTIASYSNGHTVARGSILAVGTGASEERYLVVGSSTDDDSDVTLTTGAATLEGTFVITPPLRTALVDNQQVRIITGSTHVVTADDEYSATVANGFRLAIYPDAPSAYVQDVATVTLVNAVIDTNNAADTAYTDAFGLSTGEFDAQAVTATITVSGSTMSIVATDTQPAGLGLDENDGGAVDMSGFFGDLSHNSADSVSGTATSSTGASVTPDLLLDYEDVQDTNFNSWSKVENYDQYDNSGSPRLVGTDELGPRVRIKDTSAGVLSGENAGTTTTYDADRTFLYAVTGPQLVGAHGNVDGADTDNDDIFTAADGLADVNTLLNNTDADVTLAGVAVDDDYPLFVLWSINSSTGGTNNIQAAGFRVVLTLDSAPTAVGTAAGGDLQTRAYVYHPESPAANANVNDAAFDASEIIDPVLASATSGHQQGMVTFRNNSILVDMPAYDTAANLEETDQLVIEDIEIGNIVYTLIVDIPTYSTAQESATMSADTKLPTYQFYRKVSLDGSVVNSDVDGAGTAGTIPNFSDIDTADQQVNYISRNVVVPYREDLLSVGTPTWSVGTAQEGSTVVTTLADFTATGVEADTSGATPANDSDVNVVLTYSSEGTTYIGHNATLSLPVTDHDGNTNTTVFTFRAGHANTTVDLGNGGNAGAGAGANQESNEYPIILNLISNSSGNSVD